MGTRDRFEINDDDDDRPRHRRDHDDDDYERRRGRDDDEDRPRRKRRMRRHEAELDYSDDNYLPWRSKDPFGTMAMYLGIGSMLLEILSLFGVCVCLPLVTTGVALALCMAILA